MLAMAALAACDPNANHTGRLSFAYASMDAGFHNNARDPVGKVFRWVPGSAPIDLATVPIPRDSLIERPSADTVSLASQVRGTLVGPSFAATPDQKAAIEAGASSKTRMEYTNATTREGNDTRGAMAAYIQQSPDEVAEDWVLRDAVAAHAAGSPEAPYFVIVFEAIETSSTRLTVDQTAATAATVEVPGISGAIRLTFETQALAQCTGRQDCLFDLRVYRPVRNAAGNRDFRIVEARARFVADLRRLVQ